MTSIADFRAAPAPARRADPPRKDAVRNDVHTDEREDERRSAQAASNARQFSALMALLSGAGSAVRAELLKQMPAEGSSLVDRLLDGAGEATTADAGAGADEGASVSDAMRYGQIMRGENGVLHASDSHARDAHANDARGSAEGRITKDASMSPAERILARMADRRGASVEQLLAMGDEQGADIRSALDSILDRAGTDSGAQLAMLGNSGISASAAIAAANAARPVTGTVTEPVNDPGALAPEFRSRLERVIDRMKAEHGHNVELVETTRSQERQDFLFAQGRTRPGPVVTWTQDSAHTRGEAADLIVDGKWNNAEGYSRLQRIAGEEGLRTLGARDPGHLELPRGLRQDSLMADATALAARSARASSDNRSTVAVAASASGTAGVAGVAGVAGIAGVARVADTSAAAGTASSMSFAASAGTLTRSEASAGGNGKSGDSNGKSDESNGRKLGHGARGVHDNRDGEHTPPAFGQLAGPNAGPNADAGKVKAPQAAAGADATQRATDAQDLRERTPGSISRLTMSVEGANGSDERITIDLRGKTVGAHITTDAATADGLRARTAELQDALGRHGLDTDTVQISNSPRTRVDGSDVSRAAIAERDALKPGAAQPGANGDGAASSGGRERAAASRDWDKGDDARKARDEQKEQDARRRGQQRHFNEDQR